MALHELVELRDRTRVFRDRAEAGRVLASMLEPLRGSDAWLLAIPAGGVPVAAEIARALALFLDVAVVSKITPPWNSEVGYGAVAFDGSLILNEALIPRLGLAEAGVRRGIAETREKVRRRVRALRGSDEPPCVAGRPAVLVDDGLASGFTMRAAVAAVRRLGPNAIRIAAPTGSRRTAIELAREVDELHCANLRSGLAFAVADAYAHWTDVAESEAAALLEHRTG